MPLKHSTFRWFDAPSCKTTPVIQPYNWHPPSQLQHAMNFILPNHCFPAHYEKLGILKHRSFNLIHCLFNFNSFIYITFCPIFYIACCRLFGSGFWFLMTDLNTFTFFIYMLFLYYRLRASVPSIGSKYHYL